MRSLSIFVLLIVTGVLGACDDRTPKPQMQSPSPVGNGVQRPYPVTGSQVPPVAPSSASLTPSHDSLK